MNEKKADKSGLFSFYSYYLQDLDSGEDKQWGNNYLCI